MNAYQSTIAAYFVITALLWGYALRLLLAHIALRGNARLNAATTQDAN